MSRSQVTTWWSGIVVGSLSTIVLIWMYKQFENENALEPAKGDDKKVPLALREEQLSRHALYFGPGGMKALKQAKICVIGLGGVGSHTAHMLARSGVGFLRMIDFDQVTLSSLNRHACATLDDVGTPKAVSLYNYLRKICPDTEYLRMEPIVEMFTSETGPRLLQGHKWDIIIDAIDDIPTKASLLAYCLEHHIRVISCMGAGGKADVTRLHVSDLRTAAKDPLASKLRQSLKKLLPDTNDASYLDDMEALAVVYSSEKTVVKLADFTDEQKQDGVHQYGAVDGMRIRVLPVLGTMPAIMGQALAAIALTELGSKEMQPVTGERVSKNVRNKLYQHLKRREDKIMERILKEFGKDAPSVGESGCVIDGTWIGPLMVDHDDMEYMYEIWRNKCAVTGARLGTVLHLVRWDESKPSTCDNLVLLSLHAMESFDQPGGKERIPVDIRRRVEARLATCSLRG